MSGAPAQKQDIALELTEMGLSLFVCDGDDPVECIAHVDLDDPDFSKKLTDFRGAAEGKAGKGFSTQIWLPDEQVMFRSLKLDDEETDDPRQAASSALSASTPFQGDNLCFDLGDTNGAGYTPVAAIPKEKMDEAMAFAKKMRMNPRLITTSNVVSGFSSRPAFQPHIPQAARRGSPIRAAALAMMLATPIFLLSSELDGKLNKGSSIDNAYIASVEPTKTEAQTPSVIEPIMVAPEAATLESPAQLPDQSTQTSLLGMEPAPAVSDNLTAPDMSIATSTIAKQQSMFTRTGQLLATTLEMPSAVLPREADQVARMSAPIEDLTVEISDNATDVSAQFIVQQPNAPLGASEAISLSADDGFRDISTHLPLDMFRPGPDRLPSLDMLAVEYVQNVFDDDIEIRDLMAVDEMSASAFSDQDQDPSHVRVANFGENVLVRRPEVRTAPKLVQPAFMPRPEKRPLPLLPEQAFDYNAITPINLASTGEDPPPITSRWNDTSPSLERPEGLLFVSDDATKTLLERVHKRSLANAIARAEANQNGPLANLISPKVRDAAPLAGSNGAIAQFRIARLNGPEAIEASPIKPVIVASRAAQTVPLPQIASLFVAQPSLPEGVKPANQSVAVVRELVPYQPGVTVLPSTQGTAIQFLEVAARPTLPRPPSRSSRTASVAITPDLVPEPDQKPAPVETAENAALEPAVDPVEIIAQELTQTPQTTEPDLQEEIASAAALPELRLPRPPARPERKTDVAALIMQLDPVPVTTGPISKYAIASLYAPAKRPASLAAQAKKIIEQRNSVSFQVAKKQEPVAATPQKSLRIPTGARVGSAATIKDGIALGDISLIGIFGTKKTRRALVRLPQGRYVQVSRGDRLSGWTVSAVSEDAVRIQKGSKNKVLRLPN